MSNLNTKQATPTPLLTCYPEIIDPFIDSDEPLIEKAGDMAIAVSAPATLGHYVRSHSHLFSEIDHNSLALLAALAAMEMSSRMGWSLPITLSDRRHGSALGLVDATAAANPGDRHWAAKAYESLTQCTAHTALPLLALAQQAAAPHGALVVELIRQPVSLDVGHSALRVLCKISDTMLSVIVVAGDAEPWVHACDAIAEMYAEILHALLSDPLQMPACAPGIASASLQWVLGPLAGTAHDTGPFRALPRLLEDAADSHPLRIAYRFGTRSLSHGTFDTLANAFAACLVQRGVRPHDVVPVLLAPSLEMPVAYHALMKRGAAFVPLDPAWPIDRLTRALHQMDSPVVVVGRGGSAALPASWYGQALEIDIDALVPTVLRDTVPLTPEDPIYGIFVREAADQDLCVMNNHGGLANRLQFMSRYFDAGRSVERVLQNTQSTTDSSVWQLLWPLTAGGEVVIPRAGTNVDLEETLEALAYHQVAMTEFSPRVFTQMVILAEKSAEVRHQLSSLRELVVSGGQLEAQQVQLLRALLPGLRVTCTYGSIETSGDVVFHPITVADGVPFPLGRPIDNCYVVVVDDALRPLPQGACGELVIGGLCVGDGYLNDPVRTAQSFVPSPFAGMPGALLYRTGDRGRFDAQGRLHVVGRQPESRPAPLLVVHTRPVTPPRPLLQDQVLAILRKVLGQPTMQVHEDFFACGGDSLRALQAALEIERYGQVRFRVQDLLDHPSARQATEHIERLRQGNTARQPSDEATMERDAAWACPVVPTAAPPSAPRVVLMTGASGFVGSHLAHALLSDPQIEVHALCRSGQDLVATLAHKGLWDEGFSGRLHTVPGDLALPGLGLDAAVQDWLARHCDTIVHGAAQANVLYGYPAHRAVNVCGTSTLLELATRHRSKAFHHLSTLATLEREAARHDKPLREDFDPAMAVAPRSGYGRSKWVAERVLAAARTQGLPVTVYRLGEVMPAAAQVQPNESALTHLLLAAFMDLGACPATPIVSDWSPVDRVARQVAAGVRDPAWSGRTYHVFHPERVCFSQALRRAGLPLDLLDCQAWLARLDSRLQDSDAPRSLAVLRALLPSADAGARPLTTALAGLLTDHPRLFECRSGEMLAQASSAATDTALGPAIAAYAHHLAATRRTHQ